MQAIRRQPGQFHGVSHSVRVVSSQFPFPQLPEPVAFKRLGKNQRGQTPLILSDRRWCSSCSILQSCQRLLFGFITEFRAVLPRRPGNSPRSPRLRVRRQFLGHSVVPRRRGRRNPAKTQHSTESDPVEFPRIPERRKRGLITDDRQPRTGSLGTGPAAAGWPAFSVPLTGRSRFLDFARNDDKLGMTARSVVHGS
jgi:hypothetical protein